MLKVNGVAIATPKVFSVEINDIDGESSRNARGDMLRDRIAVKRKLNLEWGPLSNGEISVILQAVQSVYFDVEYPDPMTGTKLTKNFYVGTRTAPVYMMKNGVPLWENLKMNFVEK